MLPVAGPGNERLIFNEYVLLTRNPFPTRLARVKRSLFTIRHPPSAIHFLTSRLRHKLAQPSAKRSNDCQEMPASRAASALKNGSRHDGSHRGKARSSTAERTLADEK
jgi:hypothetical protein